MRVTVTTLDPGSVQAQHIAAAIQAAGFFVDEVVVNPDAWDGTTWTFDEAERGRLAHDIEHAVDRVMTGKTMLDPLREGGLETDVAEAVLRVLESRGM